MVYNNFCLISLGIILLLIRSFIGRINFEIRLRFHYRLVHVDDLFSIFLKKYTALNSIKIKAFSLFCDKIMLFVDRSQQNSDNILQQPRSHFKLILYFFLNLT